MISIFLPNVYLSGSNSRLHNSNIPGMLWNFHILLRIRLKFSLVKKMKYTACIVYWQGHTKKFRYIVVYGVNFFWYILNIIRVMCLVKVHYNKLTHEDRINIIYSLFSATYKRISLLYDMLWNFVSSAFYWYYDTSNIIKSMKCSAIYF